MKLLFKVMLFVLLLGVGFSCTEKIKPKHFDKAARAAVKTLDSVGIGEFGFKLPKSSAYTKLLKTDFATIEPTIVKDTLYVTVFPKYFNLATVIQLKVFPELADNEMTVLNNLIDYALFRIAKAHPFARVKIPLNSISKKGVFKPDRQLCLFMSLTKEVGGYNVIGNISFECFYDLIRSFYGQNS